jgi:TonB-linked SusC/RagA family outer membrane protein
MKRTDQNLFRKLSLIFAALFMVSAAWAQQSITGTVVDDGGLPIPGVAVVLQGTATGTVTNFEGYYTIEAPADASLLFSFVGLKTLTEQVNGRSTINVGMVVDAIGLEEIVAIGYGVQKKATLTGAIGNVTSEELTQRPVANSTELLQGQVAGVVTQQVSGLPGADGTVIRIRNFGGAPLVLIDGVAGSMAQIDPNDIESISVLKDAAAAVYGARAGNGVILVNTKRGSVQQAKISYHGSVSMTQPTFLPDMVGAREWAEMLNETGLNPDDYSPNHIAYDPESKRLTNTMDGSDYQGYDWADALYRSWTPQQQHNVSATGGNEKIKYFVSAGFTDQESNFSSGDYDFNRYNIRSNVDANITDGLSISVDFSYRTTQLDKANFDANNMYNSLGTAKPVYPYINEQDPSRATYSGFLQRSPYNQLDKDFSGTVDNRNKVIQGAIQLKYEFPWVKGLSAKARLNYEDGFSWNKKVSKPFDVWEYDPIAESNGAEPWIHRGTQNTNNMKVYSSQASEVLSNISVEYDKTIRGHHLRALLVGETRTTRWTSVQGTRKDILSYEAPYLIYASEEGKDNAENLRTNGNIGITQTARASVIGRVNYDYLSKYLFEFAMRADASAEYPPEGRWGYFPSISAGWRISEESFMKDNTSAFNNLKLRASYGLLGNDAISSFDYLAGYEITPNYYIFGASPAPVIESAGLANPNISWETMKITNIGLDGTLWDGKLGFIVDGFYRLRENILAQPTEQVPNTFGASLPKTNLNSRDNRGFEITLSHINSVGNFSYHISPMFSWSRGKYVKLEEEVLEITDDMDEETKEFNSLWNARYVNEGQWDDRQWGYVSDGFFMNQQQIDEHQIDQDQSGNQTIIVGDIKYKDVNGDDYIDWRDQQVIGASGLPNIMYSMDLGAEYKNWGINMLWQGGSQYVVTLSGSAAAPFSNESVPISQHYEYRATIDADENGMDYISNPDQFQLPVFTQNGRTSQSSKGSDFWTYNATFFRLKNINISYSLPEKLIRKAGFYNCTFYLSGTNLLSVSNLGIWKNSFDPEISGANNRDYPPVKTMTFGLRLTL